MNFRTEDDVVPEAARGSWLAVVSGVQSTDSGGLYVMCNRRQQTKTEIREIRHHTCTISAAQYDSR